MRKSVYICDGCGSEADGRFIDHPPIGWFTLHEQQPNNPLRYKSVVIERHFCTSNCIGMWLSKEKREQAEAEKADRALRHRKQFKEQFPLRQPDPALKTVIEVNGYVVTRLDHDPWVDQFFSLFVERGEQFEGELVDVSDDFIRKTNDGTDQSK